MADFRENRRHERWVCPEDMTVKYAHFNRTQYFDARLRNMSDGGVLITGRNALRKGTIVTMHFKSCRSKRNDSIDRPRLRCTLALLEIQWCRPAKSELFAGYEVGARYLFPLDL